VALLKTWYRACQRVVTGVTLGFQKMRFTMMGRGATYEEVALCGFTHDARQ